MSNDRCSKYIEKMEAKERCEGLTTFIYTVAGFEYDLAKMCEDCPLYEKNYGNPTVITNLVDSYKVESKPCRHCDFMNPIKDINFDEISGEKVIEVRCTDYEKCMKLDEMFAKIREDGQHGQSR